MNSLELHTHFQASAPEPWEGRGGVGKGIEFWSAEQVKQ